MVFDAEEGRYNAALKPYPTNVGAPAIKVPDMQVWKNNNARSINKRLEVKFKEIKADYDSLMREYELNRLVLNAQFSFEPVIGKTYHLYKRENGETFLSIIEPEICNFDVVGSFYLDADRVWQKV